jgi:hypothetical protein
VRLSLLVLVLAAGTAHAYPQFQLATGTERCINCHFSPAGGGLINDYGRDEAGDTISRGGDGRFAHGAWSPPSWLQLGLDARGATVAYERAGQQELVAFPMQSDVYLRAGSEHLSFYAVAGVRGGARDPQPPLVERLVSREHYVMYERDSGLYVRAGRFFPVYGLRSQDHTAYVRRYLGFHTLEEPYGIAAGKTGGEIDVHVSAFVPRPVEFLGSGVKATGVAAYVEDYQIDNVIIALQGRLAVSSTDTRVAAGVVGNRWFADAGLLVLGELDVQRQSFADDVGPTRYQLAAYLGASRFVTRGLLVGGAAQRWQPDLRAHTSRDALEVNVQYFPRAHFELHLLTRLGSSGDYDDPGLLALLQLHYYL